ncbi:MAG: rRNA maturation RNase YbeY [Bacilli bacterium]|jgi:probable rRNA maturation factor|nr:rRNA maturation RNase YbeY [Bacilli bacterium]
MINVNFVNNYHSSYDEYEEIYHKLAQQTIAFLAIDNYDYDISVTLVNNEFIHQMNNDYRHKDYVTDVISFENDNEFIFDNYQDLGDVFISVDKAIEQAQAYHHSLKRELSFLFVHGLLHCLGYDHLNKDEEREMFRLQEVILNEN